MFRISHHKHTTLVFINIFLCVTFDIENSHPVVLRLTFFTDLTIVFSHFLTLPLSFISEFQYYSFKKPIKKNNTVCHQSLHHVNILSVHIFFFSDRQSHSNMYNIKIFTFIFRLHSQMNSLKLYAYVCVRVRERVVCSISLFIIIN